MAKQPEQPSSSPESTVTDTIPMSIFQMWFHVRQWPWIRLIMHKDDEKQPPVDMLPIIIAISTMNSTRSNTRPQSAFAGDGLIGYSVKSVVKHKTPIVWKQVKQTPECWQCGLHVARAIEYRPTGGIPSQAYAENLRSHKAIATSRITDALTLPDRTRSSSGDTDTTQVFSAISRSRAYADGTSSISQGIGAQFEEVRESGLLQCQQDMRKVYTTSDAKFCFDPSVESEQSDPRLFDDIQRDIRSGARELANNNNYNRSITSESDSECEQATGHNCQHSLPSQSSWPSCSDYTSASPGSSQSGSGYMSGIANAVTNVLGGAGGGLPHGQKRSLNIEDCEDDNSDRCRGARSSRGRGRSGTRRKVYLLDCFFHKWNPQYFKDRTDNGHKYRTCEKGFQNTQELTQHLERVHYYKACICPRCFTKFDTEIEVTIHLRSQQQLCQVESGGNIQWERWLARGFDTWLKLIKIGKKRTDRSHAAQWGLMWQAIFGDVEYDSPYLESTELESENPSEQRFQPPPLAPVPTHTAGQGIPNVAFTRTRLGMNRLVSDASSASGALPYITITQPPNNTHIQHPSYSERLTQPPYRQPPSLAPERTQTPVFPQLYQQTHSNVNNLHSLNQNRQVSRTNLLAASSNGFTHNARHNSQSPAGRQSMRSQPIPQWPPFMTDGRQSSISSAPPDYQNHSNDPSDEFLFDMNDDPTYNND